MEEARITLYLCDPEKHSKCRKTNCKYNEKSRTRACYETANPASAKTDDNGEPIISKPPDESADAHAK